MDGLIYQFTVGTGLTIFTLFVHAIFISLSIWVIRHIRKWLTIRPIFPKTLIVLLSVSTWLMVALSVEIWIWAIAFLYFDIFTNLEPAIYFALSIFTTLGFGDIVLDEQWRVLSGIGGANGFILFGLSTAYLIELFTQLHQLRVWPEEGKSQRSTPFM